VSRNPSHAPRRTRPTRAARRAPLQSRRHLPVANGFTPHRGSQRAGRVGPRPGVRRLTTTPRGPLSSQALRQSSRRSSQSPWARVRSGRRTARAARPPPPRRAQRAPRRRARLAPAMADGHPPRRRLRILCLHSWRTSGAIFREQVGCGGGGGPPLLSLLAAAPRSGHAQLRAQPGARRGQPPACVNAAPSMRAAPACRSLNAPSCCPSWSSWRTWWAAKWGLGGSRGKRHGPTARGRRCAPRAPPPAAPAPQHRMQRHAPIPAPGATAQPPRPLAFPLPPQVFVDAPHPARGRAPPDVREAFPRRDYFEWFTTEGAEVGTLQWEVHGGRRGTSVSAHAPSL
jgi:hypothetical protein